MTRISSLMATLAVAGLGLSATACMKAEMESSKKGFYAGKPDVRPADSPKTEFTTGSWATGDKASWESALRTRSMAQNEYNKAPGKETLAGKN
jgi:hypothetical protein